MKYSLDVSKYDGLIDWRLARDIGGYSMAMIKASEGTVEDPICRAQAAAARGILPRVFWHFHRANISPIDQAAKFWSVIRNDFDDQNDLTAIDFETRDGQTPATCLLSGDTFCNWIVKYADTTPLWYTYPAFWNAIGGASLNGFARFPLWLAQWPLDKWILDWFPITPLFAGQRLIDLKTKISDGRLRPMLLSPWTTVDNPYPAIWQVTSRLDTRAVPGHPAIKKACDLDVVYMDVTGFPYTPPPVPPPPEPVYYKTIIGLWVLLGPGNQYKASDHIDAGTTVILLKTEGDDYGYIAYGDNRTGWVAASCLKKV
jgi:hypothetical protein